MGSEKLVIRGGRALSGSLCVHGAKNAALKALAASLLSTEPWTLENLPLVEDVFRVMELLKTLGAEVGEIRDHAATVRAKKITSTTIEPAITKKVRASMVLTGPLLARYGEASFPHPGGCVIGERPIDLFLKGYAALGAAIEEGGGVYRVRVKGGLRGAEIFFPVVSVTGTETLMMAAVLARGRTVLKNAAMEPEIVSLAEFLNACGARISGHGTPFITIKGVSEIGGGTYRTIPDRIEAGSFALAAAATRGRVAIKDCAPEHLEALIALLESAGVSVERGQSALTVDAMESRVFKAQNVTTHEYPGFATDLQAPAVVFLTQCEGKSRVHETIFEGRLAWTQDLARMGAHIDIADPHRIFINGPTPLHGRAIESPDIRAGMAFIIAGLAAEGETEIHNVYQIDRGYERIEERLLAAGADIRRVVQGENG